MSEAEVPKIVLTGGPCAGKSRFLSQARERLAERGYMALLVPEVATEMFKNGVFDADGFTHDDFEEFAVRKQLFDEEFYCQVARRRAALGKQVVICDRGLADARCYMSDKSLMEKVLSELGSDYAACVSGYDLVIHMRTAAALSAEDYLPDENPARREKTVASALEADAATLAEWEGPPELNIVENHETLDEKIDLTFEIVAGFLDEYYTR